MLKVKMTVAAIVMIASAPSYALTPMQKMVLQSCKGDMREFCGDVVPGNGRIKACMKAHLRRLSPSCKEALFQAWLNK